MRNAIWKIMRKTVSFATSTTIALAGCASELGVEDGPLASTAADSMGSEEDVAVPDVPEATEGDVTINALKDCPVGWGCAWTGKGRTGSRHDFSFSGSGGANHCKATPLLRVWTATHTYGGGVTAWVLFQTSDCTGTARFIRPGVEDGFTDRATAFPMKSYKIIR